MNRFLAKIIPILLIAYTIPMLTFANQSEISISIDNQKVSFTDAKPYINKDNRTLVPVRFISEKMGYKVTWDATVQQVIIVNGNEKVQMKVGDKKITKNGAVIGLDTALEIKNSRAYVPLRFISETFGGNVKWEQATSTIKINTYDNYVVKSGDTLYKIANQFHSNIDTIKKANNLANNNLKIGQILKIPYSAGSNIPTTNPTPVTPTPTPTPTPSPTIKQGIVTAATLNVRKGAGVNYDIVGVLNNGDIVTINSTDGSWMNITKGNIVGWVSASYIQSKNVPSNPTPAPTVKQGTVTATTLNVRKGAGVNYDIVGVLNNGDVVIINSANGSWINITKDKLTGWVNSNYVKQSVINPTSKIKGKVIVIDPGHGGYDPGSIAIDQKTPEEAVNLNFAYAVQKELQARGATVYLTRTGNTSCQNSTVTSIELQCRVDVTTKHHGNLFISIHANWYSTQDANGTEVYYNDTNDYGVENPYPTQSIALAKDMNEAIQPVINSTDRGYKNSNYYVVRNSKVPAILIETGFISNSSDFAKLQNNQTQVSFATAFANALEKYYSVYK